VDHLRQHGFSVTTQHLENLRPIKAKHGVPADLQACHTSLVGDYVIEGHVPADVVARLLRERPPILGLAVPGMPIGSPGMEVPGQAPERYEIFSFDRRGKTGVFARR
jgi:hypothetical protein